MRRFLLPLMLCLLSGPASAGENKHLGSIVVSGSSLTNVTTAVPFVIPPGAYVTMYCTAAVQVLVDNYTVSTSTAGTKGVPVNATTLFPTTVGQAKAAISGVNTAVVAVIGSGTCDFWLRVGTE